LKQQTCGARTKQETVVIVSGRMARAHTLEMRTEGNKKAPALSRIFNSF